MMNWRVIFKVPTSTADKKPWLRSIIRLARTVEHGRLASQTLVKLEREGIDSAIDWISKFQGPPAPSVNKCPKVSERG